MVPGTSTAVVARMAVGPRRPSSFRLAITAAAQRLRRPQREHPLRARRGVQHHAARGGLDHLLGRHPGAAGPPNG